MISAHPFAAAAVTATASRPSTRASTAGAQPTAVSRQCSADSAQPTVLDDVPDHSSPRTILRRSPSTLPSLVSGFPWGPQRIISKIYKGNTLMEAVAWPQPGETRPLSPDLNSNDGPLLSLQQQRWTIVAAIAGSVRRIQVRGMRRAGRAGRAGKGWRRRAAGAGAVELRQGTARNQSRDTLNKGTSGPDLAAQESSSTTVAVVRSPSTTLADSARCLRQSSSASSPLRLRMSSTSRVCARIAILASSCSCCQSWLWA
jgi:hypothetical protein